MSQPDAASLWLIGGVLVVLGIASMVGWFLKRRLDTGLDPAIVAQFHSRVRTYWLVCTVLATALLLGNVVTVILFGLISFWALREFITLTPTRRGDHRGLFWAFFIITPLQYVLVGMNAYAWYSVVIPGFAFLFLAARVALAGDSKRFLERTAKIQAGLMICVYCLSFAPALLTAEVPRHPSTVPATPVSQSSAPAAAEASEPELSRARLLFFFVLIAQLSDVLQYVWSKLLGGTPIAGEVNPSKTWNGFFGGILSAAVLGSLLWWAIRPFEFWEAALLAALIAAVGLAGGLTMSAIKRDRGVRDFGTLVVGHGGLLDRIDSLCFAAPVFFYVTRLLLWRHAEAGTPFPW